MHSNQSASTERLAVVENQNFMSLFFWMHKQQSSRLNGQQLYAEQYNETIIFTNSAISI